MDDQTRPPQLPGCEKLIAELILCGRSTRHIANLLGISVLTVRSTLDSICERVGIHQISELTRDHFS